VIEEDGRVSDRAHAEKERGIAAACREVQDEPRRRFDEARQERILEVSLDQRGGVDAVGRVRGLYVP